MNAHRPHSLVDGPPDCHVGDRFVPEDSKPAAGPEDRDFVPTIAESSQEASELTQKRIGHFEIVKVLGQGAFGAVYQARDPTLDREVAIKVPHASRISTPEMRHRFLREARAAAGLRHPNICPVHEVGEEHDTPYIVMAYIDGQELTAVLQRRGHFTDRQAASLVRRLALALEFAHQQGIVHRDLKPDNIMLDRERKDPVIMDFGLARRESANESELTQEGQLMGTPVYMPPEQARGDIAQIGPSSDVYSLGVILYELLCGRRPHEGSLAEILSKVLTADAEPPTMIRPDIDPALETICLKAINRDIEQRYTSMAELASDLTDYLKSTGEQTAAPVIPAGREQASSATEPTVRTAPTDPRKALADPAPTKPWQNRAIPAAGLAIAVLLTGLWFLSGGRQNDGNEPTSHLISRFDGNSQPLSGVGLSPDNKWIVAATRSGTVLAWKRNAPKPHFEKSVARILNRGLRFSADGSSVLLTTPFTVIQLTIPEGDTINRTPRFRPASANATISRSDLVFVNRAFGGSVSITKRGINQDVMTALVPDSDYVAWSAVLPETQLFLGVQKSGGIDFWDCDGGFSRARRNVALAEANRTVAAGHAVTPTCLAWSANEQIAATADADGLVILWDIANQRELRRLEPHPSTVHSLAVSADGRLVLTGCGTVSKEASRDDMNNDFSIRLWDTDTGQLIALIGSHEDTVNDLAFGGSNQEAVSCSIDNTVCLWRLPTGTTSTP